MTVVDFALVLLAVLAILIPLTAWGCGWRIARRLLVFGLAAGCVQLALIQLVPTVGNFLMAGWGK
jgi:hypothetical protein